MTLRLPTGGKHRYECANRSCSLFERPIDETISPEEAVSALPKHRFCCQVCGFTMLYLGEKPAGPAR